MRLQLGGATLVRVGFTGGGSHTGVTRRHAIPVVKELEKLGLAKPFALASRSPYAGWASFAHDNGITHTFTDPLLMIYDDRVELVYIASIPSRHFPLIGEALAAGKKIIVEKPATLSLGEIGQLRKAVEKSRRPFAINLPFLASPLSYSDFINRAGLHTIGRPTNCYIHYHTSGRWMENPMDWHWRRVDGGGVGRDLLPHAISIATCLLGGVPGGQWTVDQALKERGVDIHLKAHCRTATGCQVDVAVGWVPSGLPQSKFVVLAGTYGSVRIDMLPTQWTATTTLRRNGRSAEAAQTYEVQTSVRAWWVDFWQHFLLGNVLPEICLDIEEQTAKICELATDRAEA